MIFTIDNNKTKSVYQKKFLDSKRIDLYIDKQGFFCLDSYLSAEKIDINDFFVECCALGKIDLVKFLVNKEINIESMIPLQYAIDNDQLLVVEYLIEKGIYSNYKQVIYYAAQNSKIDVLMLLIKNNIKDNITVYFTLNGTYLDIINYLFKNYPDNATVPHYCLVSNSKECIFSTDNIKLVKHFVKKGSKISEIKIYFDS